MSSEQVVEESLRGLGKDRVIVVLGLLNKLVYGLAKNMLTVPLIRLGLRLRRSRLTLPD